MNKKAFSLIEVIVALGVFSFAIVGIFVLLPIALSSTSSVKCELMSNTVWVTIIDMWDICPKEARSYPIDVPSIGTFTLSESKTFFLNEFGSITDNASEAVVKANYRVDRIDGMNYIKATFFWPALAPDTPYRRDVSFLTAVY